MAPPAASRALQAERRGFPRYRVNAQALWSTNGTEVRYAVCNLSWGGASLIVGPLVLQAGTRLQVRLTRPTHELGSAHVEVIHLTDRRMGLRFLQIDDDLRQALEELFAELTPLQ